MHALYHSVASGWAWALFLAFITAVLIVDIVVLEKKFKHPTFKLSLIWTVFLILLAVAVNVIILQAYGPKYALEFSTAYLIEYSLSIDNLFVFLSIFSYFAVAEQHQHRILFLGIMGAVLFRGVFILLGSALLHHFHWFLYLFGFLLIFTGVKLLTNHSQMSIDTNPFLRLARKYLPVTNAYHDHHFWVRSRGKLLFTPLFLVLLVVESTDIIFAFDSIPAVFGLTQDSFIAFSSNMMALLGLRTLYFLIAHMMKNLVYLNTGLSIILMFIGLKILMEPWVKIPITWSLLITLAIIGISLVASVFKQKQNNS